MVPLLLSIIRNFYKRKGQFLIIPDNILALGD